MDLNNCKKKGETVNLGNSTETKERNYTWLAHAHARGCNVDRYMLLHQTIELVADYSRTLRPSVNRRIAWSCLDWGGHVTSNETGTWSSIWCTKGLLGFAVLAAVTMHYATSREVAGSIPDKVIDFFSWPNPSSRTMALGSTQSLTEMSTRNLPGE
jgi:hypothetical protein